MVNFRKAKEMDEEFIYSLTKENMQNYFNEFLPEGWSDKKFWNGLNLENILIIESEENPIGFLDLELKEDFLYVHNAQIKKENLGKGIYFKRKIEEEAKKSDLKKIRGKVFKENIKALKLFNYWGFKISSDLNLDSEGSYWVEKRLKNH